MTTRRWGRAACPASLVAAALATTMVLTGSAALAAQRAGTPASHPAAAAPEDAAGVTVFGVRIAMPAWDRR